MSTLSVSRTRTRTTLLRPPPLHLDDKRVESKKKNEAPFRPHAIPTLYATPESAPLPDSPSSFDPSPYIVNHKRRGPRLVNSFSQADVATGTGNPLSTPLPSQPLGKSFSDVNLPVNGSGIGKIKDDKSEGVVVGDNESEKELLAVVDDVKTDAGCNDYFDPQELMMVVGNAPEKALNPPSTPLGEFYDAFEEISSEGITPSSLQTMEAELRKVRVNLSMESERRKQAEESICNLQNHWQRLINQLSLLGLTLPSMSTVMGYDVRDMEEFKQQVILAEFVAGSIVRECTRAEVELETGSRMESKNFEIGQLYDKLQFYEAANQEMSKRNQEAVESARQQRIIRKRRQKCMWSYIGFAIAIGATAVTWSYLPFSTTSLPMEADNANSHESN